MTMWLERLTKPSPTNEAPSAGELRRNDLLVAALIVFAIFLAFGIRNQVLSASTKVRLGENLPRIAYPKQWRTQTSEGTLLHVIKAGSPSTFDTQMFVTGRPLRTDESLEDARADRGIKLATTLPGFRELEAERMTVQNDQPALISTYAYVADPTRDAGANGLPVVVEAQDIMFLNGGQFLVVTLAADANDWDQELREFAIIKDSLRLKPLPEDSATDLAPGPATSASPAAGINPTPNSASGTSTFGSGAQSQTGVMPGESEVEPVPTAPATESAPDAGQNGSENSTQSEGGN